MQMSNHGQFLYLQYFSLTEEFHKSGNNHLVMGIQNYRLRALGVAVRRMGEFRIWEPRIWEPGIWEPGIWEPGIWEPNKCIFSLFSMLELINSTGSYFLGYPVLIEHLLGPQNEAPMPKKSILRSINQICASDPGSHDPAHSDTLAMSLNRIFVGRYLIYHMSHAKEASADGSTCC